jgi:hypothetical protein
MKRTPKPPIEKSSEQRDDLDPVARRRLDRLLSRPKYPPWAPDPAHPDLRRWVISLTPHQMHIEVLDRLKIRNPLVTRFLIAWPGAFEEVFGFALNKKKAVFPTLLSFLERITINEPFVEHDGQQFPMLSTSGPQEIPPGGTSAELIELVERHPYSIQNIRARFKTLFLTWLFSPRPDEDKSLGEYQELRKAVKDLGTRNRPRHHVINEIFSRGPSVTLGNRTYPVPPRWRTGISSKLPPAEIARLLLSVKWKLDPQAVKELLAQAPIMVTWTAYKQWLDEDPARWQELRVAIRPRPMIVAWPREWLKQ